MKKLIFFTVGFLLVVAILALATFMICLSFGIEFRLQYTAGVLIIMFLVGVMCD